MNTQTKAGRSKSARAQKLLNPAEYFFYENAGWSYDPKTQTSEQGKYSCAIQLASAEKYVKEQTEWTYEWEWDSEGCQCDGEKHNETHGCILRDGKKALTSLWGICDPNKSYIRVVEAELAIEAIEEYRAYGASHNA